MAGATAQASPELRGQRVRGVASETPRLAGVGTNAAGGSGKNRKRASLWAARALAPTCTPSRPAPSAWHLESSRLLRDEASWRLLCAQSHADGPAGKPASTWTSPLSSSRHERRTHAFLTRHVTRRPKVSVPSQRSNPGDTPSPPPPPPRRCVDVDTPLHPARRCLGWDKAGSSIEDPADAQSCPRV